jgi:hypothetical protein
MKSTDFGGERKAFKVFLLRENKISRGLEKQRVFVGLHRNKSA